MTLGDILERPGEAQACLLQWSHVPGKINTLAPGGEVYTLMSMGPPQLQEPRICMLSWDRTPWRPQIGPKAREPCPLVKEKI